MSEIADVTPLLDVVFTLNLVAPSLFKLIETTRTLVTDVVVEEVRETYPDFAVSQNDRVELQRSVVLYFPALKKTFKIAKALAVISALIAIVAFLGIAWAAIAPHRLVGTETIIVFAFAGIAPPIVYLAMGMFLDWAGKILIGELRKDGDWRDTTTSYFRDFIKRNQEFGALNRKFERVVRAATKPKKGA